MRRTVLLLPILLAACGTPGQPEVKLTPVNVAVPMPCKVDIGADPRYPDTDEALAAVPFPGAGARLLKSPDSVDALKQVSADLLYLMKLYRAGRGMRIARDIRKSAALDGCAAGVDAGGGHG